MKGARNLTDQEIDNVYNELKTPRDKCLFMLGVRSGLRISELLSLKIKDIMEYGKIGTRVNVAKCNTKGKQESKSIPLAESAKVALQAHLDTMRVFPETHMRYYKDGLDPNRFLFESTQSEKAITRSQAHNVLKDVFNTLKLEGKCATHSMRKSYCKRVHTALGEDVLKTQKAMFHRSLSSTASYLEVDMEEVERAILSAG